MNSLYNITFKPVFTFCALNFFDRRRYSPNTLLIEEKTISAIHVPPASFSCFFHRSNPSFLIRKTSSFRNGYLFDLVDAFFLILIAGSAFMSSSIVKFLLLLSYALSAYVLYLYRIFQQLPLSEDQTFLYHEYTFVI
jgi:hypothetical protein